MVVDPEHDLGPANDPPASSLHELRDPFYEIALQFIFVLELQVLHSSLAARTSDVASGCWVSKPLFIRSDVASCNS